MMKLWSFISFPFYSNVSEKNEPFHNENLHLFLPDNEIEDWLLLNHLQWVEAFLSSESQRADEKICFEIQKRYRIKCGADAFMIRHWDE